MKQRFDIYKMLSVFVSVLLMPSVQVQAMPKERVAKWFTHIACASALMATPSIALAEEGEKFESDTGGRIQLNLQATLNDYFKVLVENQTWFGDDESRFQTYFVRPAIIFTPDKNNSIWLGYMYSVNHWPKENTEQRTWEQFQNEIHFDMFTMVNRLRLEQRFFDGEATTGHRLRHLLRLAVPLNETKTFSAIIQDENFFHLNDIRNRTEAGFDRTWFFAGINHVLDKHLSVEGGYLLEYVDQLADKRDSLNHSIILVLSVNF